MGLPDRDYYTRDDEKSKKLRDRICQHVTNMFKLLGDSEATAAAEAKTVMEIETRLAKVSMPRVDLRDPDKIYHKMPVSQFQELAPNVNWEGYFKEIGAPPMSQINVFQPDFMKEVSLGMDVRSARGLESVSAVAVRSCAGRGAAEEVRGREFRIFTQGN